MSVITSSLDIEEAAARFVRRDKAERASSARSRRAARRRAEALAELRAEAMAEEAFIAQENSAWGNELTLDEINESRGFIVTRGRWYC